MNNVNKCIKECIKNGGTELFLNDLNLTKIPYNLLGERVASRTSRLR